MTKKIIQVGIGGFGISWLEILKNHQNVKLVAVVDVLEDNLTKAKEHLGEEGVNYFTDYEKAFEETNADVAVIITPPQTHKKIALKALENDLHVFMEKPIAHSKEDAIELNKLAKQFSSHVMISQNYRYRPEIQSIKNAVEQGKVGPVEYVEWNFRRATKFGGWRDQYQEIIIEDMSIHHFDLLRYILGKNASSVFAKSMRPSWSWFNGNPTASVVIDLEDVLVNYFASWVTSGPETSWNGECKLYGENGVIALIDDIPYFINQQGEKEILPLPIMEYEDREYSINEMVNAINEGRMPDTVISDNIHSFNIVTAAVASINSKKEVFIEEEKK